MLVKLKRCKTLSFPSKIEEVVDIGIRDGTVETVGEVKDSKADKILDIHNDYVVPVLVDLHCHVYHLGTSLGVNADEISRHSGVGVFVDAGSSGAGNFAGFRDHVIECSDSTIYAFLNIGFGGIPFFGIQKTSQIGDVPDLDVADSEACIDCVKKNAKRIIGIKVRLGEKVAEAFGLEPLKVAKRCSKRLGLPVMMHFGSPYPEIDEAIGLLEKGDILTHTFRPEPNSIIVNDDEVLEDVKKARKRGVIIDVGHGFGSFSFKVARAALADGFAPDTISTDLHTLSYPEPVRSLENTMSKLLCLGMPLTDAIKAVTYSPAMAIGKPEHASIIKGSPANLVILGMMKQELAVKDTTGQELVLHKVVRTSMRFRGTEIRQM